MEHRDHEHQEFGITWNLGILVFAKLGISLVSGSTETYKSGACARTPNELQEFGSDLLLSGAQYFGNRNIVNAYLLT